VYKVWTDCCSQGNYAKPRSLFLPFGKKFVHDLKMRPLYASYQNVMYLLGRDMFLFIIEFDFPGDEGLNSKL